MIRKKYIIAVSMIALIAVIVTVSQAMSSVTLDGQRMSKISGMGCCQYMESCRACINNIKCTMTYRYQECRTTSEKKFCGDCLNFGTPCGDMDSCTGPNCTNCTPISQCWGCNSRYADDC